MEAAAKKLAWNQYYHNRREPWVHGGNRDEVTEAEGADKSEWVSTPISTVPGFQQRIKHLESTPGYDQMPALKQQVKELQEQLEAERLKADLAKPASSQLQSYEAKIRNTEKEVLENNKKLEAKQTQLTELQAEVATITEFAETLNKRYEEEKAVLKEKTASVVKAEHDMDISEQVDLDSYLSRLETFLDPADFLQFGQDFKAKAEQHRQAQATKLQEQEAEAAKKRGRAAGSNVQDSRRSNSDDEGEVRPKQHRSRSRSKFKKRDAKFVDQNKLWSKFNKDFTEWNQQKPMAGDTPEKTEELLAKWYAEQPTAPDILVVDDDSCL